MRIRAGRERAASERANGRPQRRAGFTLIELMVSLVIGALVVTAVFSLGGATTRHFQEQQRVGVTQRAVRTAMERLRRDISRAGYLHVSSNLAPTVQTCNVPPVPTNVPAVQFLDSDPGGNTALDLVNRTANNVSADRLRLTGGYATGDQFLVRTFNSAGNQVFLQTLWLAFRRNFVNRATGSVDTVHFNQVFRPGRMLHIESPNGAHFFVNITGSTVDAAGVSPRIDISPGIGVDNPCIDGLGRGALVTPISEVEYVIAQTPGGSSLNPNAAAVSGPNTQLIRRELDMDADTELAGTRRTILEYAIDFNIDWVVDTNITVGNPPNLVIQQGAAAQTALDNTPWQVRSAIVRLAARTPEQDPRFPWPDSWAGGRPVGAPLNRYRVFPTRPGAARVRQLTTEIQMPNLIPRI